MVIQVLRYSIEDHPAQTMPFHEMTEVQ